MSEQIEASSTAGEQLIKEDLITREDLDDAMRQQTATGTPWYKQLLRKGKVTFESLEQLSRIEFHGKHKRAENLSLGETLVQTGALTEAQLKDALTLQKKNGRLLGNLLLDQGFVSRAQIAQALALQHGMEFASLEKSPSQAAALEALPESLARKSKIIPVALEGDRLTVLAADPQALERVQNVGILLGKRIHVVLTAVEDVKSEISRRYHAAEPETPAESTCEEEEELYAEEEELENRETTENVEEEYVFTAEEATEVDTVSAINEKESQRFEQIQRAAAGASVMKMVSTIIEGAANSGATDIHLDPQEPEMRVRYRIDGVLHDVMSIPTQMEAAVVSRIKIISELDITETRHPQDGHIGMEIGGREFDIRVATLPTFLGERVVLRMLDQSSVLAGIKDLGLEDEDEESVRRLIQQPYGMILVTGPTGSGKTTTLYAALNQKNVMTDSIVTLEDPIEYQLSGINQVQIDNDIDLTFANTLRASLRQDIDVLLVGEIRDTETARIAIRAAMTGHLVFSTLHTNDAPEAIATLRNMGIPSYLISSALTAVIAQRLVRTICADCAQSFKPSATLLKSIGLPATTKQLTRGAGCDQCFNTGNRGRSGVFEVLEITPTVRTLIAADAGPEKLQEAAKLKTMAMRCRQKVKNGEVTPEEFLRIIRT